MAIRSKNQQNPPLPKRKRVDAQGNNRKRLIVKDGGATIIIAEGATQNCYECAWKRFTRDIEAGGGKITVVIRPIN